MALGGTAVGAGLGMWAGFLLWNKMWGVYPVDAQALIAGETTLLLVTMLACLAPALRATKANPSTCCARPEASRARSLAGGCRARVPGTVHPLASIDALD